LCEKEGIVVKWKWALGIVFASIVLLGVAVYVILLSYNYNSLKPKITRAVKDDTGRELTLGGATFLSNLRGRLHHWQSSSKSKSLTSAI
jgi:uncharacterized protein involved in outer membrane biogenesis